MKEVGEKGVGEREIERLRELEGESESGLGKEREREERG